MEVINDNDGFFNDGLSTGQIADYISE